VGDTTLSAWRRIEARRSEERPGKLRYWVDVSGMTNIWSWM
jgi:hypothetical protein